MSTETTPAVTPAAANGSAAAQRPAPPAPAPPPPPAPRSQRRRRRYRFRFSLQSKILVLLLAVSILSTLIIGGLGLWSGIQTLETQLFSRLDGLRAARTTQLETYLDGFRNIVLSYSEDFTVIQATRALREDFRALQDAEITAEQEAAIQSFYTDQFIPALAENTGESPNPVGLLPISNAAKYLQYNYTIKSTNFEELIKIDDPGDGSDYSASHRVYQPIFRNATQRFQFDDFVIADAETGDVIYSAFKGIDLGTNLLSPPNAASAIGRVFNQARSTNDVSGFAIADFEDYLPSYGLPAAFVASPILDGAQQIGVLIIQVPSKGLNDVMTGRGNWQADGLGETGEVILVGSDYLMRSQSRFLVQDPEGFKKDLLAVGEREQDINYMLNLGTTIMQQEVRSPAALQAIAGETGSEISTDYRGHEVLTSYAPLNLDGLYWVIVAKIDASEALAPINTFARQLVEWTLGIIIAVTVVTLLLSRALTGPIRRLTNGARAVAAGDLDTEISVKSGDEIGELGEAFNSMTHSLREHAEQLDQQQQENERMLLNLMPDTVARRYRRGEDVIAEHHNNVTVLFADIAGFVDLSSQLPAARSAAMLNQLVRSFDDAADRFGVEKVKTLGAGYMAVCGVSVPRVDHAKRAVDFALELLTVVERFNRDHQTGLGLRIGIDSGPLTAGIVGQGKFVYDMWGDTVNLAYRVQRAAERDHVAVTSSVHDKLQGVFEFESAGEVESKQGKQQPIWSVKRPDQ